MNTQEEFRTMWANGLNQANEIAQHLDPEMRLSFRAALDRVVSEVGGGAVDRGPVDPRVGIARQSGGRGHQHPCCGGGDAVGVVPVERIGEGTVELNG